MSIPTVHEMFDLSHTLAASVFEGRTYPWEILGGLKDYVYALGESLGEEYEQRTPGVWIHRTARVAPSAAIEPPAVIDREAEVRHCAYIRGSVIVGAGAVVGNSTELKNCLLFDGVQVPHYNYVGDSVYGYRAHTGAGVIASNVKGDRSDVTVKGEGEAIPTGRYKVGAMLGDFAEVGCNSVLCPGAVVGPHARVYPLCRVRGTVPAHSLYKAEGEVVSMK